MICCVVSGLYCLNSLIGCRDGVGVALDGAVCIDCDVVGVAVVGISITMVVLVPCSVEASEVGASVIWSLSVAGCMVGTLLLIT